MKSLQRLYLQSNQLSGLVPACIETSLSLSKLILDNNFSRASVQPQQSVVVLEASVPNTGDISYDALYSSEMSVAGEDIAMDMFGSNSTASYDQSASVAPFSQATYDYLISRESRMA